MVERWSREFSFPVTRAVRSGLIRGAGRFTRICIVSPSFSSLLPYSRELIRLPFWSQDPNVGGRIQFSLLLRQTPRPSAVRALEGGIAPERVTQLYWSGKAVITLSAGYVGSELLGGVFIVSPRPADFWMTFLRIPKD